MSATSTKAFPAETWAARYAKSHYKTDPGITAVYFLPVKTGEREVRLVEVNRLLAERAADTLEPYVFGVDVDGPDEHQVLILDVTPNQWQQLKSKKLPLPAGWSLEGKKKIPRS